MIREDKAMQSVFLDVLEPEIKIRENAAEKKGAYDAYRTMAERMINAGKPGDEISMFTNLGRQDIDVIATRLHRTVSWG